MRNFDELKVIGDGAFGTVTKARDKDSGEYVAIKKMKQRFNNWDECLRLNEVKSLRKIKHENVVRLIQVFRENDHLYLVFELLQESLLHTLDERVNNPFTEPEIRYIMKEMLNGIGFVHRQGFFHRDLKPDNLLWDKNGRLKIADFGLAREIRSRPPFTEYISTRWYRAPEIILRHSFYNSPADMWAVGCIMAELYMMKPIFQGSSETDQFYKICAVLGPPNSQTWPDAQKLAAKLNLKIPTVSGVPLSSLMPNASPEAIDLMSRLLAYEPAKRPSASQALGHSFFDGPMENPYLKTHKSQSKVDSSRQNTTRSEYNTKKSDKIDSSDFLQNQKALGKDSQMPQPYEFSALSSKQDDSQYDYVPPAQQKFSPQAHFAPTPMFGTGAKKENLFGSNSKDQFYGGSKESSLFSGNKTDPVFGIGKDPSVFGGTRSAYPEPYNFDKDPPRPSKPASRLAVDSNFMFGTAKKNPPSRLIGGFQARPFPVGGYSRPVPMDGAKSAKPELSFGDDDDFNWY